MRVFVSVEMGDADSEGLQTAYLSGGFELDLGLGDAASHEVADKSAERCTEYS
jgi:hypothetical protein